MFYSFIIHLLFILNLPFYNVLESIATKGLFSEIVPLKYTILAVCDSVIAVAVLTHTYIILHYPPYPIGTAFFTKADLLLRLVKHKEIFCS